MGEEFLTKDEADKGEIVIYQPDEITKLEVRIDDETVWLNRHQLAVLFDRDVKTIGKHIKNATNEELSGFPVVANFATTASDGKTYIVEYFNLEMILSIGYRVKSQKGIHFRRWANSVLKQYLLNGFAVNRRLNEFEDRIDRRMLQFDKRLDAQERKMDILVHSSQLPKQGIFYDGQIYDAYAFVSDLIGASIKDLGKKWFGFTLMENTSADDLLRKI